MCSGIWIALKIINILKMNLFLKITAIFEGLTGLFLIIAPQIFIQILFLSKVEEASAIFIARIAGSALFSLALLCWYTKDSIRLLLKILLFYNTAAVIIAIYSIFNFSLKGIGVEVIICFHLLFALWNMLVLKKQRIN
ncbi:hypothetical protein EAH81_22280 [Flavobacterium pectinovorum]|uniref:Uncharacterized protein n=2 Tax=Flavobacterium pectinovorum TaxID=29533 RepID=A0A502EBM4_9FLAO|nr:hypothetical protein EAH81_22280 [Flavobacterium pectinovorum]